MCISFWLSSKSPERGYIKWFKDPREDLHQMVLKLSFGFRQNCSPVHPERADQPEKKECSLHIPMLIKYDHCDLTWTSPEQKEDAPPRVK